MNLSDYLTTAQAAEYLGVSHGRVKQLVADEKLPKVQIAGRNLIPRAAVENYRPLTVGRPKHKKTSS